MSPRREAVVLASLVLCWLCAMVLFPLFAIIGEKGAHVVFGHLAIGSMVAAVVSCLVFMIAGCSGGTEDSRKGD